MALTDLVALSLLPVNWWRQIAARLRTGWSAADLLETLVLERRLDTGATPADLRATAARALAAAELAGAAAIPWSASEYPPLLAAIADPPPVLWVAGCLDVLRPPAVAIVGSRAGSPYALAVAERLAADLVSRGVVVVSGLARGVDSAAHRGALEADGATIGVLGCGLDLVYPSEHRALAGEMRRRGAVVSELVPGTPPLPHFFPLRNRIISGLSRAIVVIEAGEKSGSLITARLALEQGRDVLAVPGNVLNGRNRGGHALLRDGAKVVETADDILEELNVPALGEGITAQPSAAAADPLLACLPAGECCDLDAIVDRSGVTIERVLPRLLDLELRGLVKRAGGGRFVRI
jgi:DNA processing protein